MKDAKTRGDMTTGVGHKFNGKPVKSGKTPGKYVGMSKVQKGGKATRTSKHY